MKPGRQPVQSDLFSNAPTAVPLAGLQLRHGELVELLSQLLWELARSAGTETTRQSSHEQGQP